MEGLSRADEKGFRAYLGEFGLSDGTLEKYVATANLAALDGGWIARLKSRDLAPKTKRLIRAAARHWADWQDDSGLRAQLKRLRLPAPRRVTAKVPLPEAEYKRLLKALGDWTGPPKDPAMRAVIAIMAYRGLRVGDVLRLRRQEVSSALTKGVLAFQAKGERRLEFAMIRTYRSWLEVLHDQPRWQRVCDLIAPRGEPEERQETAGRKVRRALADLGVELGIDNLHPHRLRRTYAVAYLRANKGDPEAMVNLTVHMQWAGIATAMEYVNHARGRELDAVAETLFDRDSP